MISNDVPAIDILDIEGIDARYKPVEWDFARDNRAEIDAHWATLIKEKPSLFNGTVLMQHSFSVHKGIYKAAYTPVDYASFTAWIRLGQPGQPRRNGFAMGALRSRDGAFLLGVMGPHTFNAGKIYFPAGTPDMNDVTADGIVDLASSVTRELSEETGLRQDEIEVGKNWTAIVEGYRCAFIKPVRTPYDADTAKRIILERLVTETDQELCDIVIVRGPADIDEALMPGFAQAYMRRIFQREASSEVT